MKKHSAADRKAQIKVLVTKLKKEPNLLQKRITEGSIEKALKERRAAFKIDPTTGQYCAFCIIWLTRDNHIFEVGDIWVDEKYRRQGYGGGVFKKCLDLLPEGAGAFLITRELSVLKLARSLGWQLERNNWTESKFWSRIAEPWDRYEEGTASEGVLMFWMP
ncbi:MAG TPA: GNAT family N-acetyltransferase [Candidatus Paceibacterota bacterium]|nr:GNAT family N-acetyltransferase [Candidatus Paceibacterota bacterium]